MSVARFTEENETTCGEKAELGTRRKSVSIGATPVLKEPGLTSEDDKYDLSKYLFRDSHLRTPEKELSDGTGIQLREQETCITYRKNSLDSLNANAEKERSGESKTKERSVNSKDQEQTNAEKERLNES